MKKLGEGCLTWIVVLVPCVAACWCLVKVVYWLPLPYAVRDFGAFAAVIWLLMFYSGAGLRVMEYHEEEAKLSSRKSNPLVDVPDLDDMVKVVQDNNNPETER